MQISGSLNKMQTKCNLSGGMVDYNLVIDGKAVLPLNDIVGKEVSIKFNGSISCVHCGKKTKKSFGQGACWICFNKLACNDMCIMKPETCHFAEGTCREPKWAKQNCFMEQCLYLARSGSIKIGITRFNNQLVRWADQGASEAMVIGKFPNRFEVGKAEKSISDAGITDRTSWHKMLKNEITNQPFEEVLESVKEILNPEQKQCLLDTPKTITLDYPHLDWPKKVKSTRLDKTSEISGVLTAIKGQYLIFDNQVINIRSHAGYDIDFKFV